MKGLLVLSRARRRGVGTHVVRGAGAGHAQARRGPARELGHVGARSGQRAGIFKKHGLNLEILYTQGRGETQQAVISGSVDIGVAAGVMGVLAAYSKGAPVRVIGAETTGAKGTRDGFFPRAAIDPDQVVGLDSIVQDAVAPKYTAAPLTQAQLGELIRIPPRQ